MGLILAPIVDGKIDTWRQWATDLEQSKAEEFKDLNSRYGLTRHSAWLAETPNGHVVAALHEGPGSEDFMSKLASSDHEFDVWFREKITEIHNLDFNVPFPGSPPQLLINEVA